MFYKPPHDDEEEYERFDMEDEFEGAVYGEDGEFYFKEKKDKGKRRRPTKEQQIYGDFINVSAHYNKHSQTSSYWDTRDFETSDPLARGSGFNSGVTFVKASQGPVVTEVKRAAKVIRGVRFDSKVKVLHFGTED